MHRLSIITSLSVLLRRS